MGRGERRGEGRSTGEGHEEMEWTIECVPSSTPFSREEYGSHETQFWSGRASFPLIVNFPVHAHNLLVKFKNH